MIYLDNCATTKVAPEVVDIMIKTMTKDFGNPSSMHMAGVNAEEYIKNARKILANILKVKEKEIYFTSGGTEGNNQAIIGSAMAKRREGNRIITSSVEHASVKRCMEYLEEQGFAVIYLPVDNYGRVDVESFRECMTDDTILVSIMAVNNEVGAVEQVEEIGRIAKSVKPDVTFHVDAIQAFAKMEVKPKKWNADIVTVSGHKFHGPKGVGFIYINEKAKVLPVIYGGGQQNGKRSGTENVPGIAGLAVAAKLAYDKLSENTVHMTELKDYFIGKLNELEDVKVHSLKGEEGAPHIVSAGFKGVRSEVLLHALEDYEIYISAGSACSSNKPAVSSTLKAMKVSEDLLESTVRFSFCKQNTKEELDFTYEKIRELLPMLRKYVRK